MITKLLVVSHLRAFVIFCWKVLTAICRMIESGDIVAQIDDAEGMVRFLEDPHSSDSPELLVELDRQISQSIKLADRVQSLNYEVRSLL